jgi:hypothetical protein
VRRLSGEVRPGIDHLLCRRRWVVERRVDGAVAPVGGDQLDEPRPQHVRRPLHGHQHPGDRAELFLRGAGALVGGVEVAVPLVSRQRANVRLLDAGGVPLDERQVAGEAVTGRIDVIEHLLEVELLVLEDVDQLVRERDPHVGGHVGPPHRDAFGQGVVEGDGGGVGQVVRRLHRVEVGRHQAQRPERRRALLDHASIAAGELGLVDPGPLRVLLGREEVDGDGMVEAQPALVLDEVGQVDHARVPPVGVPRRPVLGDDVDRTRGHPEAGDDGDRRQQTRPPAGTQREGWRGWSARRAPLRAWWRVRR